MLKLKNFLVGTVAVLSFGFGPVSFAAQNCAHCECSDCSSCPCDDCDNCGDCC